MTFWYDTFLHTWNEEVVFLPKILKLVLKNVNYLSSLQLLMLMHSLKFVSWFDLKVSAYIVVIISGYTMHKSCFTCLLIMYLLKVPLNHLAVMFTFHNAYDLLAFFYLSCMTIWIVQGKVTLVVAHDIAYSSMTLSLFSSLPNIQSPTILDSSFSTNLTRFFLHCVPHHCQLLLNLLKALA